MAGRTLVMGVVEVPVSLLAVVVDFPDPIRTAEFWAQALDPVAKARALLASVRGELEDISHLHSTV